MFQKYCLIMSLSSCRTLQPYKKRLEEIWIYAELVLIYSQSDLSPESPRVSSDKQAILCFIVTQTNFLFWWLIHVSMKMAFPKDGSVIRWAAWSRWFCGDLLSFLSYFKLKIRHLYRCYVEKFLGIIAQLVLECCTSARISGSTQKCQTACKDGQY